MFWIFIFIYFRHFTFKNENAIFQLVKICQIRHVIFESTSHFSFKFCINAQCHQTKLLCIFFISNIIYFVQKQPMKVQIFEIFEMLILMLTLNWKDSFSSNFVSFFIVMTHNSPVNFRLIHFLLGMKGSHQTLNFETFMSILNVLLVKICLILLVIFEITSQFSLTFCINIMCQQT